MTVIVYGPQGCGKTKNAKRIAEYFKCDEIVEGWPDDGFFGNNALILTNEMPEILTTPIIGLVIDYYRAMDEINSAV